MSRFLSRSSARRHAAATQSDRPLRPGRDLPLRLAVWGMQSATIYEPTKCKLREFAAGLDPLQLLEEIRALQSHLVALADGSSPDACTAPAATVCEFLASFLGAWRAGEVRPTHVMEPRPRYLRQIQTIVRRDVGVDVWRSERPSASAAPPLPAPTSSQCIGNPPKVPEFDPQIEVQCERQRAEFGRGNIRRQHAFAPVWPLACRRLVGRLNFNATELFDELRARYPGRWHRGLFRAFGQRVRQWREDARARGIEIGSLR